MSEVLQFSVDETRGNLMRRAGGRGTLFGASHARLGNSVIDCYEVKKQLLSQGANFSSSWLWGWSGECPAVVYVYSAVKGESLMLYKLRVIVKCIDWGLVGMSDKNFAVFCSVIAIEEGNE